MYARKAMWNRCTNQKVWHQHAHAEKFRRVGQLLYMGGDLRLVVVWFPKNHHRSLTVCMDCHLT